MRGRFFLMKNKFLLDTHILLWWLEDDKKLKKDIKNLIVEERNQIFVSVVSFWEISIKNRKDKLPLKTNLKTIIKESKFNIVNITPDYVLAADSLSKIHKDPFDRMLIAQAKTEKLKLITADPKIWRYKISITKA